MVHSIHDPTEVAIQKMIDANLRRSQTLKVTLGLQNSPQRMRYTVSHRSQNQGGVPG
ncbi:MAG TPA: hypothetical protein VFH28_01180 [Nitrososphaera sp.]|nr:hypothetical protein [Nitrososphaera sp.]